MVKGRSGRVMLRSGELMGWTRKWNPLARIPREPGKVI